jgi:hypothetical protein
VNTVTNLRVPQKEENLLTSCMTTSFSKKALLLRNVNRIHAHIFKIGKWMYVRMYTEC